MAEEAQEKIHTYRRRQTNDTAWLAPGTFWADGVLSILPVTVEQAEVGEICKSMFGI
jgi:hypothetical protein